MCPLQPVVTVQKYSVRLICLFCSLNFCSCISCCISCLDLNKNKKTWNPLIIVAVYSLFIHFYVFRIMVKMSGNNYTTRQNWEPVFFFFFIRLFILLRSEMILPASNFSWKNSNKNKSCIFVSPLLYKSPTYTIIKANIQTFGQERRYLKRLHRWGHSLSCSSCCQNNIFCHLFLQHCGRRLYQERAQPAEFLLNIL